MDKSILKLILENVENVDKENEICVYLKVGDNLFNITEFVPIEIGPTFRMDVLCNIEDKLQEMHDEENS